jgi:hypothetical protein
MPFHVKRTDTSKQDTLQQYNGIRSTRWVLPPPDGKSVLEIQTTHTPMALQKVPEGKNYLTPPYHCTFLVMVGCGGVDGKWMWRWMLMFWHRALVSRRVLPRPRRVSYSSLHLSRLQLSSQRHGQPSHVHVRAASPQPRHQPDTDRFLTHISSRYIFTLEGKDTLVSASDPQPVRIPARARHTFKVDDTHEGPCTVEISTNISPMAPGAQPDAEGASAKL